MDDGLQIALKAVGGAQALGPALGVSRQAVMQWKRVPSDRVLLVEKVSGIPRHMLRPDLYPADRERLAVDAHMHVSARGAPRARASS